MKVWYAATVMSPAMPIKRFGLFTVQNGAHPGWFPRGLCLALGPLEGYIEMTKYIPDMDMLEVYLQDLMLTNEDYERDMPMMYEPHNVLGSQWEEIQEKEQQEEEEEGDGE